jgi:hypothetical protein
MSDNIIGIMMKMKRYNMKISLINESHDLRKRLVVLRPSMVSAAQLIYDEWDEEEGGICDMISSAFADIMSQNGIESTEGGHEGDDHSYMIAYDDDESYAVDIDHTMYEIGGGYSWTKIPNVVFDVDDIIISRVYRPDWI